jgi:hypothetical protein
MKQCNFHEKNRFFLDDPDGYLYYFHDLRKEKEFGTRHHRREAGVMVWGAITSKGEILNGIQNAQKYRDVLIRVKPIIERTMDGLPWVFQHDHAAVHSARLVSSWLEEENINVLEWPSVSPETNILENVWGWVFRQLYGNGQQYHNVGQLTQCHTGCLEYHNPRIPEFFI